MLEVVIPALREPRLLLDSLARGERRPDLVTIVSNEVAHVETDLPVRFLRFRSDQYYYGDHDVVLRRNIGIWHARGDRLVFQDDDQIAPVSMLAAAERVMVLNTVFWGHHRFVDFAEVGPEVLLTMPPDRGRSRENPPNHEHGHWSCYAGMFGGHQAALQEIGFDMLFLGRHGSEDQNFGYRSMLAQGRSRIYVWEPPFAWHPLHSPPWPSDRVTNSCEEHQLAPTMDRGVSFQKCKKCPYRRAEEGTELFLPVAVFPFDPALVEVTEES
jgi:hypothetical protein